MKFIAALAVINPLKTFRVGTGYPATLQIGDVVEIGDPTSTNEKQLTRGQRQILKEMSYNLLEHTPQNIEAMRIKAEEDARFQKMAGFHT